MNLFKRFAWWLIDKITLDRNPDFIVGTVEDSYLLRWWIIPRNKIFNVYLHCFLRDDDDRALHDHPWAWCSILLNGCYVEHTIDRGGVHKRQLRTPGDIKFSLPSRPHRVELIPGPIVPTEKYPCWTLFITGPRVRQWGFHCPQRGWVHFKEFTNPDNYGEPGKGCDE